LAYIDVLKLHRAGASSGRARCVSTSVPGVLYEYLGICLMCFCLFPLSVFVLGLYLHSLNFYCIVSCYLLSTKPHFRCLYVLLLLTEVAQGPNRVGAAFISPEHGNMQFPKRCAFFKKALDGGQTDNMILPSAIHHRQNPLGLIIIGLAVPV
jgi:hypothetical protein